MKLGDVISHPLLGNCFVEGFGTTFDDIVQVFALRDYEGELVLNSQGQEVADGICFGTDPTPIQSVLLRTLDQGELIRVTVRDLRGKTE